MFKISSQQKMQRRRLLATIGLCLFALFALIRPSFAQDGNNWLQALVDGHISLNELKGGTQFLPHPVLQASVANQLDDGYSLFMVGGDILKPAAGDYCSMVLTGSNDAIVIPANRGAVNVELVGFCLELPTAENGLKPDEFADYLPINYAGQADEEIRTVLQRARDGGLARDFGTQLAIWQTTSGLTRAQLATELGQDLATYSPVLDYLVDNGPAPVPTAAPAVPPTVVPVVADEAAVAVVAEPTAVPTAIVVEAAPIAVDSAETAPQTRVYELPFGLDQDTALIGGSLLAGTSLLALVAMLLLMRRRRTALAVAARRQPRAVRAGASGTNGSTSRSMHKHGVAAVSKPSVEQVMKDLEIPEPISVDVRCLICNQAHETRDCPNIQRPNQVFVPTEVELTLANVEEGGGNSADNGPSAPEIDAFWGRYNNQPEEERGVYLEPSERPTIDDEFYEAVKGSNIPEIAMTDTTSVDEDDQMSTSPVSRKHVTYIIREKGKTEIIGSLGDDGGILSRVSLKNQQILLPPKDVSTPHAILRIRPDGRVTLKDLRSKNGTFVFEEALEPSVPMLLQDGAEIRFGDSASYQLDLENRKLLSLDGGSITRDLSSSEQWLITRRNLHTIVVNNSQISTPHMLIRASGEDVSEIQLKDLGSHNPTLIGGEEDLSDFENCTFVQSENIDFRVGDTLYTIKARSQNTPDTIGDHYKVIRQIYISKMADVYQVQDTRTLNGTGKSAEYKVAKLLNIHQEKKDPAIAAFDLEIELMNKLSSPHILRCEDAGHDLAHDAPFYVMPFLDGSDLRRIMQYRRRHNMEGGLPLGDIQAIYAAMLDSVQTVHDYKYGHCDIKPANIFITPDDEVYLLDLGVATEIGEQAEFYTQFYSAPEVGAKQLPPVSPASDIYSLGIVLFELITGMEAKEMTVYLTNPSQEIPDTEKSLPNPNSLENLERWLADTSYGLDFLEVIHKAIQYVPTERHQTIDEFRTELEAAYAGERVQLALSETVHSSDLAELSIQSDQ